MKPEDREFLEGLIKDTHIQENLFHMANQPLLAAFWILERVKLRSLLTSQLLKDS